MIIDSIKNCEIYFPLGKRVEQALKFILDTDFSNHIAGKYEIDDNRLFFLVVEYKTKEINDCLMESHKKYIDIQFMYNGNERVGHTTLANQTITKEYDLESDYVLYKPGDISLLKLEKNDFAVFFPDDLHMPGIVYEKPENVKKIVVKILI